MLVVGACAPCVWLSGPAASPCRWFSTELSGSYGDALPSCCVSAPCGTKECLLDCPILCLGVDVGFLGFADCAGGLLFSEYGTDSI